MQYILIRTGHDCEMKRLESPPDADQIVASDDLAGRQSPGIPASSSNGFLSRSPEGRQSFCATNSKETLPSRTTDVNYLPPAELVVTTEYGDGLSCALLSCPVQRLGNTLMEDLIPRRCKHLSGSAEYC